MRTSITAYKIRRNVFEIYYLKKKKFRIEAPVYFFQRSVSAALIFIKRVIVIGGNFECNLDLATKTLKALTYQLIIKRAKPNSTKIQGAYSERGDLHGRGWG